MTNYLQFLTAFLTPYVKADCPINPSIHAINSSIHAIIPFIYVQRLSITVCPIKLFPLFSRLLCLTVSAVTAASVYLRRPLIGRMSTAGSYCFFPFHQLIFI